jgi:hypothetical protein
MLNTTNAGKTRPHPKVGGANQQAFMGLHGKFWSSMGLKPNSVRSRAHQATTVATTAHWGRLPVLTSRKWVKDFALVPDCEAPDGANLQNSNQKAFTVPYRAPSLG